MLVYVCLVQLSVNLSWRLTTKKLRTQQHASLNSDNNNIDKNNLATNWYRVCVLVRHLEVKPSYEAGRQLFWSCFQQVYGCGFTNVTTIKEFRERSRKNKLSMDKKSIVSLQKIIDIKGIVCISSFCLFFLNHIHGKRDKIVSNYILLSYMSWNHEAWQIIF